VTGDPWNHSCLNTRMQQHIQAILRETLLDGGIKGDFARV
jgi:hypothetical protein